jgi:hypothetical protein
MIMASVGLEPRIIVLAKTNRYLAVNQSVFSKCEMDVSHEVEERPPLEAVTKYRVEDCD